MRCAASFLTSWNSIFGRCEGHGKFYRQSNQRNVPHLFGGTSAQRDHGQDIVEKCGINRNSFYYHYQDLPALIEEIIKEEAEAIIRKYGSTALCDGVAQLNAKVAALVDGSDDIDAEAAGILRTMQEEGLRSILNRVGGTATELADRLDALLALSEAIAVIRESATA